MKTAENGMKMLIVSSYPPRKCGIATFANDIVNSIDTVFGNTLPIEVCALRNEENNHLYGDEVTYVLYAPGLFDYRIVAEKINKRDDIGLVCIQHEFGLFGGEYGEYLLSFLIALNKPVITVFHTILPEPEEKRKKIVQAIAELSDKIVVLTKKSKTLLTDDYGCQVEKINIIPHGNHSILWEQKQSLKNKYAFADKVVMSTFGLISKNKNIETVLYALPDIIRKHPEVIYLVLGKTHPEVIRQEGEEYRNKLQDIVKELHLDNHVIFIDQYLELKQLLEYLTISDIYLFSSKDPNQAVSGTFTYAMSCGCAVISTPIPHAIEYLENGNGILLKEFDNPEEFTSAILRLLRDKEERVAMGSNAFLLAHASIWENIAIQYGNLFGELTNRSGDLRFNLPPVKLDHIIALTTESGIIQFSKFSQPDPDSGYTLDDNARALIVVLMYYDTTMDKVALELADIYLKYIEDSQRDDGWFDNFKDDNLELTSKNEEVNLGDANGRALWSLGYLIANRHLVPSDMAQRAERCWEKALKRIYDNTSPRAIAYMIKGLYLYYSVHKDEEIVKHSTKLSDILLNHYHISSEDNWHWYEDYLTYANNVLPEAMIYSYLVTRNERYRKIAVVTFDFLLSQYFMKGKLQVISNRGWFIKRNERIFYGEQPMEVSTTVIALDLFYEVTKNIKYKNQLELAFSWFLGNNHLKQIMYNTVNGASYDGLEDKNININQGAESSLCFLKAQMIMNKYAEKIMTVKYNKTLIKSQLNIELIKTAEN